MALNQKIAPFSLILAILYSAPGWAVQKGMIIIAHGSAHGNHQKQTKTHAPPDHHHHKKHSLVPDEITPTLQATCSSTPISIWEKHVVTAVQKAQQNTRLPLAVAFGMWETKCFQQAIAELELKSGKLDEVIILPLFISSHSAVIEAQKYIFHQSYAGLSFFTEHWFKRIQFSGKITYLSAIDYHPVISEVLVDRAVSLLEKTSIPQADPSITPNNEIVLVMHGPLTPQGNQKWIKMGNRYARDLLRSQKLSPYVQKVHVISLQDDAPGLIRNKRTKELRTTVIEIQKRRNHALILPLLLSEDGIQKSILDRLKNLNFIWSGEGLLPDPRLSEYLIDRIKQIEF